MSNLYLDIETIGTEDADVIADIAANITPPKNYTKADTIAAWEKNDKPTLVKEAIAKTALDGGFGQVICIGWAFDDLPAESFRRLDDEELLISDFFAYVYHLEQKCDVIDGHNIGWDLRFLYKRAVIHRLQPPPALLKAMKAKPWDVLDTMLLWDNDKSKMISLEKLCRILGVETSKGDMDGSKVWEAYRKGRLDEIAAYCESDVEATRQCYKRLTWS
jgi:predicted PolB exonuclease-like 3'-5' exonuclease